MGTDAIVSSCAKQQVCLYDGAQIGNADDLQSTLPQGVQVVVIPRPDQAQAVSSNSVAEAVRAQSGKDTVIVIEDQPGSDRFAVSSTGDAAQISKDLYSQGQADGGAAVAAISGQLVPAADGPDDGGGLGGAAIVSGTVAVVAIVAAISSVVAVRRNKKKKRVLTRKEADRRLEADLDDALNGEDGEFVSQAIDELEEIAQAYPDLGGRLPALTHHVSELFVRVRKRGTDQQVRLLQGRYKDTLGKLLKALGPDYYGDIRANPQYWSNPGGRLDEVRRAIESVDQQAVDNIRQVNESRDLEFQVALDSLSRSVTEAKLSDVYSDRDTPDSTPGDHRPPPSAPGY
jgi:hypothetical protein